MALTMETQVKSYKLYPNTTCPTDQALHFLLQLVYKISGIGIVSVGLGEAVILKPTMMVTFAAVNVTTAVMSLKYTSWPALSEALLGEQHGFKVKNMSLQFYSIANESKNDPPREAAGFTAQMIILNLEGHINAGHTPVVCCYTALGQDPVLGCYTFPVSCKFAELRENIDHHPCKKMEDGARSLTPGDADIVGIVPITPMCGELLRQSSSESFCSL